jgi:hypothetical protein
MTEAKPVSETSVFKLIDEANDQEYATHFCRYFVDKHPNYILSLEEETPIISRMLRI